ncbi:hypothetical protein P8452_29085 [Trifolium repens]|nr:hypothetical protein P8452_29085 [Trifolium repens]
MDQILPSPCPSSFSKAYKCTNANQTMAFIIRTISHHHHQHLPSLTSISIREEKRTISKSYGAVATREARCDYI